MLRHVASFELRYQLRSPAFWVTFAVFFLMAFGAAASDQLSIGGKGGNVMVNAPFVIAQTTLIMTLFGLFVAAAFVANAVVRDDETRFGSIIHSSRLPVRDYLIGRFMGSWSTGMLVLAAVPLGNAVGAAMPWLDPETVGPFNAGWYLYAWLALCGPTLLIISATLYSVAIFTRSMAMTYVSVMVLIVGYLVSVNLISDPRHEPLVTLLDPFGLAALSILTKYWTAIERNTMMPALEGALLYNRLIWIAVTAIVLAAAVRLYRIDGRAKKESKTPSKASKDETVLAQTADTAETKVTSPAAALSPRQRAVAALLALVRHDMVAAFRHPGYIVLVFIGCVNAGAGLWFADESYGTATLPVTRVMIDTLRGAFTIIPLLIAIYYAGELVWGSRDRRMHEIIDATPAPDWTFALPKMLAISLVLLSTLLFSTLMAMTVQLLKGYGHLEVSKYLLWYVVPSTVDVILFTILAVFVQSLVPAKAMGWLVMMLFIVAQTVIASMGFEHPLYLYAASTPEPLSDMNGQGQFAANAAWFRAYWSACALLLAVLAATLWRRGTVVSLRTRIERLPRRLVGVPGVIAGVALLAMASLGGWIFYNTNVLNEYRTAEDDRDLAADYEKTVNSFEKLPQPRITDVMLNVDLYPKQLRADIRGRYVLENRTAAPIPEVHVSLPRNLEVRALNMQGATLTREWKDFGYRIFRFNEPLAPGARATLDFDLLREQRGFPHRAADTRLVANGTFLDNFEISPMLGPNRNGYLQDRSERRKRGLPPESRPPRLEDDSARAFNMLRRDSDWVNAEITVSTDADQLAIAPGYRVSEVVREGRRIVRYRTDAPIQNFFSIQSARYAVARDRWNDVELAVYHHPPHDTNVRTMLEAMKVSLEVFSKDFSPFQFKQLRILEFPAYATFAQSFANTVPYSEAIGFIQHRKDPDDIDMVTYITAHEIGHQWWAHQLIPSEQQGATLLVESMAQYSALRVMEKLYGPEQIRKFLKYELDRYLRARGSERLEELPLARVENQGYIHYQKGGLAMYLLKEEVGTEVVDRTLRRLLSEFAFKPAPYANASDFLRVLREEAGPYHEQLITDLFERITLYDLKLETAESHKLADGRWQTTLSVQARKLYVDGQGKETATPLDGNFEVGLFTAEPGKSDFTRKSVLKLERRTLRDGAQQIVLYSNEKPVYAGIDPYNKRIDRDSDDNVLVLPH
ncbi:MAG: aminopeptidase [Gammaproteobacteria bacterium]|nr:aminopeptidase [Gammaproteobacteria bacterium]